jgi:hypothetical protein
VSPTSPRGIGREPDPDDWQRRPRESARRPRIPDDQPGYRGPAEPDEVGWRDAAPARSRSRDDRPYPDDRPYQPEPRGPETRGRGRPAVGRPEWGPDDDPDRRASRADDRRGGRSDDRAGWPDERVERGAAGWPDERAERGAAGWPDERAERGAAGWPDERAERGAAGWPEEHAERGPGPDERGARSEQRAGGSQRSRLRRPHKRRAVAGQQTGLDPGLQSDLPSWLQERGISVAPVRRLLSVSVAGFAALLGFGLLLGAYTQLSSYAFVIFGVQLFFVLAWTVALRPPGAPVVATVGLIAAIASDFAVVAPADASLAPLGYVTVGGFVLGVIGQLLRGGGREGVTESLGATLAVVVGGVAFASLLVLDRRPLGTQSIVACLAAAAVALVVSRLSDIVLTTPRTSPEVPRGAIGVIAGAMAGTLAAAVVGSKLVGLHPTRTAIAGLVTAMAAIMADLAVSYAEAGRELEDQPSSLWIARHMQGPASGFALAAPAAYVLSVMLLVSGA